MTPHRNSLQFALDVADVLIAHPGSEATLEQKFCRLRGKGKKAWGEIVQLAESRGLRSPNADALRAFEFAVESYSGGFSGGDESPIGLAELIAQNLDD